MIIDKHNHTKKYAFLFFIFSLNQLSHQNFHFKRPPSDIFLIAANDICTITRVNISKLFPKKCIGSLTFQSWSETTGHFKTHIFFLTFLLLIYLFYR